MVEHIVWLSRQLAAFVVYFWPVSITVAALFVVSFLPVSPRRNDLFGADVRRLIVVGAVVVVAQLALSLVFARESATTFPPTTAWPGYLVIGLAFAHFAIALAIMVRAERYRLRLAGVMLGTLWISIGALFVAFMSVSGAASI